jgi:hypothetical protein
LVRHETEEKERKKREFDNLDEETRKRKRGDRGSSILNEASSPIRSKSTTIIRKKDLVQIVEEGESESKFQVTEKDLLRVFRRGMRSLWESGEVVICAFDTLSQDQKQVESFSLLSVHSLGKYLKEIVPKSLVVDGEEMPEEVLNRVMRVMSKDERWCRVPREGVLRVWDDLRNSKRLD